MAMNLASLIPLSLHPLSVVSKDLAVGGQKIGRRWPTRLLHWAVLTDKLVCYNDAGCLQPGKRLCKCSSGKKKKIPQESRCSVGCLVLCDWHSRMRLSCLAAPELDSQMFSHWKSKGPNLNFIIQPDIADQQNVLTQKYDNKPSRWRMASVRWVGGGRGSGMEEEVMESSGWLPAHLSCTHKLEGT